MIDVRLPAASSVLRVAFLGAGQMARHHADALRRTGQPSRVVGVYDQDAARAAAFSEATGATAYAVPAELFAQAAPDVVHVCTPPAAHFTAALEAITAGAHVYVEKPFALTRADADALLDAAAARGRIVCGGHQLLADPAYRRLLHHAGYLGAAVHIDSAFAFRPAGGAVHRMRPRALAEILLDILPHPLYVLVHALDRCTNGARLEIGAVDATASDLHATLRAGGVVGRLTVSLRARPVASSLTIVGTEGSLTADFVRSMIAGIPHPGTAPLEKLLAPVVDGAAGAGRAAVSAVRRVVTGNGYAGLAELIADFHRAILEGRPSPTPPAHLLTVSELFERLSAAVNASRPRPGALRPIQPPGSGLIALTGASGFLGREIAHRLSGVRGMGRRPAVSENEFHEWATTDLSRGLDPDALRGVDVVVHAAAETAGGFAEHQRNTVDATRHLLRAMHGAGVRRLVLVSSLSVIRPPGSRRERQDERTPRPSDAAKYGPYTWGKCQQEEIVARDAHALGIAVRIVRPGALMDPAAPELPGLVGRRLFGRWHLGLGRPGLPTAVCDVGDCAAVVAWITRHFDEAPQIVNLFDPRLMTRRDLLASMTERGWNGRVVWVPISAIAAGVSLASAAISLLKRQRPVPVAAWSILRPRRFDGTLASQVLAASRAPARPVRDEAVAV